MKVVQAVLRSGDIKPGELDALALIQPDMVLVFGACALLAALADPLKTIFASTVLAGCSTAGEISMQGVTDDSCVVTAVRFTSASVKAATTRLTSMQDSQAAGQRLAAQLPREGLRAVLVLGQGVQVNGSALILGLTQTLGPDVLVTGGLAGDAAAFTQTWVLDNQGAHTDGLICLGLYGQGLRISHGSFGGWSPFGPARKVTRCQNNVLFELDGEPALDVYRRYLGEYASGLPASGLLFPFAMLGSDHAETGLIRTMLGMDEQMGSLTLAGDIDPDGYMRLMHASTDALVDGAEGAAIAARQVGGEVDSLAVLVSCVGRKLVMGDRVEEEVDAVRQTLGAQAVLTGLYSNGEISPLTGRSECRLHNQTMTITLIAEH
jgi:hypothetical protein